jgi:hypothetical protein
MQAGTMKRRGCELFGELLFTEQHWVNDDFGFRCSSEVKDSKKDQNPKSSANLNPALSELQ